MKTSKGWFLKMSRVNQGGEQKSGLTSRQKAIIQILTQFTAANPVTVAAISDKLKISSRTVLREMPTIEAWLAEHDFTFLRKPGVGLVLDESMETRSRILELLNETDIVQAYSKEERRRLILGELLFAKEPLKFYYFTSKYKISDGTLSNDLDHLGEWLRQYQIHVIRKPGLGIYTEGSEDHYRQAIANAIYEFMTEEEILGLFREKKEKRESGISAAAQSRLFHFIDDETFEIVEKVLSEVEQQMHIKYTDSAYMGLLVHIALAVKRLRNFEKIEMEAQRLESLKRYPEYSVAEEIGRRIAERFAIEIPQEEIGFITMHCISAQIWLTGQMDHTLAERMNMRQLVKNMVDIIEREMGISLSQNEQLLTDLTEHITAVSSRLRLHVKVRNAQLETIKENYGEIYRATEKSCQLLRHAVGVAEVPEAEVAFIAMYICAAVEDQQSQQGKIPVVVVCPTGLGTSKMLAVQLTKEFHNLEVREIISAFRIDIQKLQREGIRLLISTVHLDIDFPYVCVNPILLEQDKILLRNELRLLPTQQAVVPQEKPAASLSKDGLVFMTRLGEEILYLLDHVQLLVLPYAQDKQELLYVASGMFTETQEARELIADSLAKREQISSTYIRDFQMMLLHCKTGGVKHCCFGYIRLKRPLFQSEGVIEGAIVMLVPKEGDSLEAGLMSEISSGLLEDEAFFSAVQKKGRISIIESLEKRLMQYYQKTISTRMEGS